MKRFTNGGGGGKDHFCRANIVKNDYDYRKVSARSNPLKFDNLASKITEAPNMMHKTIQV